MKVTLTKTEMLELRRVAGGLGHSRADCSIERTDGLEVDEILLADTRKWYLDLLDTGELRQLAPEDISASVLLTTMYEFKGAILTVPDNCRRVFSVTMDNWRCAAPVLPASEYGRVAALQMNPYTAATEETPVAVLSADGKVHAWPGAGKAQSVIAVTDPGPDLYILDDSALPSPQIID